ncbi:hypothetical protein F4809DRAFT_606039 [Biscogniauxia mediterranea]|nr:hypothetical protein F4809DRAFT_606039 [Biscogniauxia mediterranea]
MQKILRRVATAERVVAKRRAVRDRQLFKKERKSDSEMHQRQIAVAKEEFNIAKQAVRDDWAMGPLSPRLEVGEWDGTRGSIHEVRFQSDSRMTLAMRNRRCQWAGGAYNLNLVVGDRVVLIDGPDKGRIGHVQAIDHDRAELTVKGLNKTNVRVQVEIRGPNDPPALNMEMPIPISSVRLVHPIQDPETGVIRDVIINRLVHGSFIHDRQSGEKRWDRIVPGLNVSIPWPPKPEEDIKDYKGDTLRIDVEERTFTPTLLTPPMPESVIDELRGPYSRFRTRHQPEYIARLEAEEQAKRDRQKLMDSMRTPLQEFHRAERANKKKKGKPRLTLEMLEKIGEVIARNRERALNADTSTSPYTLGTRDSVISASSETPPSTTSGDLPASSAPPPPPPPPSTAEAAAPANVENSPPAVEPNQEPPSSPPSP